MDTATTLPAVVEVTILQDGADGEPAYQVEMSIPVEDDLPLLVLRDMSYSEPNCPELHFSFGRVENARVLDSDLADDRRVRLEPAGDGPVSISYRIQTDLRAADLTVAGVHGCNILLARPDGVFLDGGALLLAPRSAPGVWPPYRVGRTVLRIEGLPEGAPVSGSLARQQGSREWDVERFDDLRFAFFATGAFARDPADEAGTFRIHAPDLDQERRQRLRSAGDRLVSHFSQHWREARFTDYTAYMIETTGRGTDLGESVGMARGNAHVLFHGPATDYESLLVMFAHELAHSWIPSRLGQLAPDHDWSWLREGLTDYLARKALIELDLAEAGSLVDRLNLALQNTVLRHTPQLEDYDEGLLIWAAMDAYAGSRGEAASVDDLARTLMLRENVPLTPAEVWQVAQALGLWPADQPDFVLDRDLPCMLAMDGQSFTLVEGRWPLYATGWQLSEESAGVVERVEAGTPAQRAGLAVNDRITSVRSGGFGNVHRPVELALERAGEPATLSFMPRGATGDTVYRQYVADVDVVRSWADVEPSRRCRGASQTSVANRG
jgi:predicted metalloprotease with PDZ domain